MIISKIKDYLLLALLLVLPWQTRLIYKSVYIQYRFWEYGSLFLYGSEILLAIVIIFWIVDSLSDKSFLSRFQSPNIKRMSAILGVYAILFFYFFISVNRDLAWQYLNWMIYSACLFVIILQSKFSFYKISLFLWLGSLTPACLGIYQFFSQSVLANKWLGMSAQHPASIGVSVVQYLDERWLRAYGSFGSPNAFGIYLSAIFLLGIILILKTPNIRYQIGLLVGQVVILSALFFSFSRGAYLGAIVGIVMLFVTNRKNILFFQQLVVYFLLAVILFFSFRHLLFTRVNLANRLESKSISERVTQWQDFKIIFKQNPIFGVGPGNYPLALRAIHIEASVNYFSPIHNVFLLFIGQFGLFGFTFVIYGFWFLYKLRSYQLPALLALAVSGLFDHWMLSMFTGWIFMAIILALAIRFAYIDTNWPKE